MTTWHRRKWQAPVVPQTAIDQFYDRELRDLRFYKRFTDEDLATWLGELPTRPPIWNKLQRHQKICLLLGAKYRKFAFWCDTGTGKTLLSIALARYFRKVGVVQRVLVLVPTKVVKVDWENEILKHSPNTPFVVLTGSTQTKWEIVEDNPRAQLLIETYDGLLHMLCSRQPNDTGKGFHLE